VAETASGFLPPDPEGEFAYQVPIYLLNLLVAVGRVRDAGLEKALRPTGLGVTRYRTLAVIRRLQPCTMTELAIISATDRTSLTRTVDSLVTAGLAARHAGAEDRRKVELSITPAGLAALREAEAVVNASNAECLAGIPDETQRSMVRGLEAILGNMGTTAEQMERVIRPRQAPPAEV
jgi:MarR family transcriptional regulator, lower aerobic nicotinate degradation pathway regulator